MILTTHEGDILIFKYVQENKDEILIRINRELENFIDSINSIFYKREITYKYYRVALQNNIDNYSSGYKHCRWMQRHNYSGEDFFNYLEEYFTSLMPILEQNNIYGAIADLMDQQLREVLIDNFETLKVSNFNLSKASQDLYIHKNTLVFRLNKIKNFFGIDPLHNNSDQFFLSLLHSFLKRSDKIKTEEV
jgi:carbohydrate diacid regulator